MKRLAGVPSAFLCLALACLCLLTVEARALPGNSRSGGSPEPTASRGGSRPGSTLEPEVLDIAVTGTQSPRSLLPGLTQITLLTLELANSYPVSHTLTGLAVQNTTTGPGNQAQKDGELGQVSLRADDGDGVFEPSDQQLGQAAFAAGGRISFGPFSFPIPMLASARLFVIADVPLAARDGDLVDLAVQSPSDVTFESAVTFSNAWPVAPPGSFPIDGMSAAQLAVHAVGPGNILAGSTSNLALDVVLPANGYEPDVLEGLSVTNQGTAVAGSDIAAVRAWVDDGDGAYNPATDWGLGALLFTGDRWQLTGLSEPVTLAGLRVFLSVDLSLLAAEGRTVRLGLPTPPNPGVGMRSGNDGPLDGPVGSPFSLAVSTSDRVTLTTAPLGAVTIMPGDRDVELLHVVATNSYADVRTVTSLTFSNATTGAGGTSDLDGNVEVLVLRADGNGDGVLGDLATDPALGTAFFSDGKASFAGLAWQILPGQTGHLFLTADVSIADAADGDVLSARVAAPRDVSFQDTTRTAASWPLDSDARCTIDGMAAAQVTNVGAPGVTLAPSDGPVLAMDLIVPRNGYANDMLSGIRVVNLGSAGPSDLAELRLWRDGGDGLFTAGSGDDRDLGPVSWQGGFWESAALSEALTATGARVFLALTVSNAPTDSATVRLAVPVGGIEVLSPNDGPLDRPIENPNTILLDNSPLLAQLETVPRSSTVGQQVSLLMVVRNAGVGAMTAVTPSALTSSGGGRLDPVSGPTPSSFDLAPGAADTFAWVFAGGQAGGVTLTGNAEGTDSVGTPRRSLDASSNVHQVFSQVDHLDYAMTQSMPASVNRGQTDVVPMSLTFTHSGGAQGAAVRVTGLRIRLEDGAGGGIVPSGLLSQVIVNQGTNLHLRKTALESAGAEVDLTLASPVLIGPTEEAVLALRFDVSPSTTVSNFRVVITDSSWIAAEDANSGAPVAVRDGIHPLRTELARVVAGATEIDVAGVASGPVRVGRFGQLSLGPD